MDLMQDVATARGKKNWPRLGDLLYTRGGRGEVTNPVPEELT